MYRMTKNEKTSLKKSSYKIKLNKEVLKIIAKKSPISQWDLAIFLKELPEYKDKEIKTLRAYVSSSAADLEKMKQITRTDDFTGKGSIPKKICEVLKK